MKVIRITSTAILSLLLDSLLLPVHRSNTAKGKTTLDSNRVVASRAGMSRENTRQDTSNSMLNRNISLIKSSSHKSRSSTRNNSRHNNSTCAATAVQQQNHSSNRVQRQQQAEHTQQEHAQQQQQQHNAQRNTLSNSSMPSSNGTIARSTSATAPHAAERMATTSLTKLAVGPPHLATAWRLPRLSHT